MFRTNTEVESKSVEEQLHCLGFNGEQRSVGNVTARNCAWNDAGRKYANKFRVVSAMRGFD